jgi:ABC-type Mn2+/Zn2+ transport system ATPase subunit
VDFPESHLKRRVTELSGGQMQKLLLAAELSRNPDILFLDEPLSNVDHSSEKHIIDVIMEIKNQGVTIVLISHDWQLYHPVQIALYVSTKTLDVHLAQIAHAKTVCQKPMLSLFKKLGPILSSLMKDFATCKICEAG